MSGHSHPGILQVDFTACKMVGAESADTADIVTGLSVSQSRDQLEVRLIPPWSFEIAKARV
jgi:hypothetical protein